MALELSGTCAEVCDFPELQNYLDSGAIAVVYYDTEVFFHFFVDEISGNYAATFVPSGKTIEFATWLEFYDFMELIEELL